MKIATPCPACGQTPVDALDLWDGEVWVCLACGYQDIGAGVDVEAQVAALAVVDPRLAACWRETLGLLPVLAKVDPVSETDPRS